MRTLKCIFLYERLRGTRASGQKASVLMIILSYPTETVLSKKITRNRLGVFVLSAIARTFRATAITRKILIGWNFKIILLISLQDGFQDYS